MAVAGADHTLGECCVPGGAVSNRAVYLAPAARSERGACAQLCDGPRAAVSFRRGDDFHGQFPGTHLLVLGRQRIFAVGLPLCLETGVVERFIPARYRLSAA